MQSGRLILVVGPSGAGKDTLLEAAASQLADDTRFIFPKRWITRVPQPSAEDHEHLTWEEFTDLCDTGEYTLAWEAHGLGYIIPASVITEVDAGKIAVCNGSRRNLHDAVDMHPNLAIIVIDADKKLRAERLSKRGRESAADIAARLAREVNDLPEKAHVIKVDNSGALEKGIGDFIKALESLSTDAKTESTPA